MERAYVVFIDTVDLDNYIVPRTVQSAVQQELIDPGDIYVVITARAYWHKPEGVQEFLVNEEDSEELQWAAANRLTHILHRYSHQTLPIFRGGIARNPVIPNSLHFREHLIYGALNPETSTFRRLTVIDRLDKLVEELYTKDEIVMLSGGPLTGAAELIMYGQRDLTDKITGFSAIYAHLDDNLFSGSRFHRVGNFNTSADAPSGKAVLEALNCDVKLITTDITKDHRLAIGDLDNFKSLIDMSDKGNKELVKTLAEPWYNNVIKPYKSQWFLYDFMLTANLLTSDICEFERMRITEFPAPINDMSVWGKISFEPDPNSNIYVTTELKDPDSYFDLLRQTLRGKVIEE